MSGLPYAEDAPQCMTNHVLDRYEAYLKTHLAPSDSHPSCPIDNATIAPATIPASLEEALAPLEIIYGKTFLSAVAIALHGAEPVIRYLEAPDGMDPAPSPSSVGMPTTQQADRPATAPSPQHSRSFYRVGDYVLYSPFYCPCSAYAFQSVRRQEVWCCKHMLALQIALRVESSGIPQDNLRERVVDSGTFQSMLLNSVTA